MLIGGVVDDVVHDDADIALASFGDEVVEVGHGSVGGVDGGVVGDIVAVVDAGRGIHRSDPDGVDAEGLQIVEAGGDAFDVADAVAVGILKTARVDLVENRVTPPFLLDGGAFRLCCGRRLAGGDESQGA